MTSNEAIRWLRRRTAIALFHQDRIIVVLPHHAVHVEAAREGFVLEISEGFVLATSDPGDRLEDVVAAARDTWKHQVANAIDTISDSAGVDLPPARLTYGHFDGRFDLTQGPRQ